jgi:hypothetical protein
MNAEITACEIFSKPETMTDEAWYAIDLSDPLMMVC